MITRRTHLPTKNMKFLFAILSTLVFVQIGATPVLPVDVHVHTTEVINHWVENDLHKLQPLMNIKGTQKQCCVNIILIHWTKILNYINANKSRNLNKIFFKLISQNRKTCQSEELYLSAVKYKIYKNMWILLAKHSWGEKWFELQSYKLDPLYKR